MLVDWLEMAQRLAAGARAKVAEDRAALKNYRHRRLTRVLASKRPLSVGDRPDSDIIAGANGYGKSTLTAGD
jgi:hypothetical protein